MLEGRLVRLQLDARTSASASAACCRCTPTSARTSTEVYAGDIAAIVGLKNTFTGDTLCDQDHADRARDDHVPRAGHPRRHRAEDQGRPGQDGHRARQAGEEDPTFRVRHRRGDRPDDHRGHGRAAPRGDRRPHAARVQVEANVGRPQVAYRETITQPARAREGRFVRQSGGRGQFGDVELDGRAAGARARASSSSTRSSAARCRGSTSRPIEAGRQEALESGVLAGYPVVDVKVDAVDGSYHEVDSSEWPSRSLARWRLKEALRKASPSSSSRS